MSSTSDIQNLRAQVANDLDIYKAEKIRFYRLQDLEPEEVTEADRMSIINWSRASIRDYSFRLEQLENLDDPTVEQKEVMQLLNRLIMLGDEVGLTEDSNRDGDHEPLADSFLYHMTDRRDHQQLHREIRDQVR